MEAQEEVTTQNIVKGKRTKRQRVQSPIPFALTTNSSSDDGGGGSGGGGGDDYTNGIIKAWSPTSSNELLFQDNATEEEEDMANCLILLAQGNSRDQDSPKHHLHKDNIEVGFYNNYNNNNKNVKFNSRRFLETGSPGSGKAGYYVYECKTCSRTFPSFQALGGHRASHKKPKAMNNNVNVDEQKKQLVLSSDEVDGHYKNISSLSLQLSNSNTNTNRSLYHNTNQNSNNKSKIHECSICGAEFTSGQALGGHMRRHRGPIGGGSSSALSLTPLALESEEPQKARNLLSLDLDLNLPAPDEEDKLIHFASKQQQQQQKEKKSPPIVFSSPALVDCHY